MQAENQEKPLTFSQLTEFYRDVMRPEIEQLTRSQLVSFYREVIRPEMEQSNFAQLLRFYRDVMRPEMEQMMDDKIVPLRQEMLQGFDDLYKKFETLEQEYVFANVHIKRLNQAVFDKKKVN